MQGRGDGLGRVAVLVGLVASLVAVSDAGAQDDSQPTGSSFGDVEGHWAADHISALDHLGVLEGTECGEAMLCPDSPLKRETMAVWLVRVLDGSDPEPVDDTRFLDVDGSHRWAAHIERFAELGVTDGYGDGTYRPDVTVSRAQMASFLARAFELPAAEPAGFGDIAGDTHEDNINRVAAVGITTGCGDGTNYCPNRQTSRAQMAVFIGRALDYVDSRHAQSTAVAPATLAVGGKHSCMVRTDGTVACWGDNEYGQAEAPNGTFNSVAAGREHSCGLRSDDTIVCWGRNQVGGSYIGQADPPAGAFKSVAAAGDVSCGLRIDDTLQCWGDNYGQADPPAGTFKSIAVGGSHSCGVRTDETVACWGSNYSYRYERAVRDNVYAGQADPPSGAFGSVAVGNEHSCGVRTDGTLACWGANVGTTCTGGDTGNYRCRGERDGRAEPPGGTFKSVAAGWRHTCGLRSDDTVDCWGRLSQGRIVEAPRGTFKTVETAGRFTCGLRSDDRLACWGDTTHPRQVREPSGGTYKAIAVGWAHSCAVRADETAVCWTHGSDPNSRGEAVPPDPPFVALTAGTGYVCGLRSDGTADCWGWDWLGRTQVPDGRFEAVSAGNAHGCVLRPGGTVDCWGPTRREFLGVTFDRGQQHPPRGTFKTISSGAWHTCGVRSDDTIECWGDNDEGQADPPAGTFKAVSSGGIYTCGCAQR